MRNTIDHYMNVMSVNRVVSLSICVSRTINSFEMSLHYELNGWQNFTNEEKTYL